MESKLVPIERRQGVTIYGRVVEKGNKLGQYEVHSDFIRDNKMVYHNYADAEKRMAALIGASN